MSRDKQIEEIFRDLSDAPIGAVKEDFTIGTMKESHTDMCIRTIAGHLVRAGYRKQKEGEWIFRGDGKYGQTRCYCSVCGKHSGIGGIRSNQLKPFCPNCGAKMGGDDSDA